MILTGPCWLVAYYDGKTKFIPCKMLPEYHLTLIPIVGVFGWFMFLYALFSSPKKITKENVKEII